MPVWNFVRPNAYHDSVTLMRLTRDMEAVPGVTRTAAMMATPANRALLTGAGLLTTDGERAGPADLVIAITADSAAAADTARQAAESALTTGSVTTGAQARPRTLAGALRILPDATLALVSVPGPYAGAEARAALRRGLDVMLFSDNVPLATEVALKREALERGRFVMGPDCGTAILHGVPLGFANAVPRGRIGLVAASGTGLQEVTCRLAATGEGVSHAIGVGSRDLGREVGGLSTLAAIDLLDADPTTARIVLISKPPHPEVVAAVLARVGQSRKRFTLCFLGAATMELPRNASAAATLSAAAEDVLGSAIAAAPATSPMPAQRDGLILGLYAGGSLAAEAQLVLIAAGRAVVSNAAVSGAEALEAAAPRLDRIIDLGADEFTRGRPHPMIDPAVRSNKLRRALADPNVAVILIDIVLGLGAHPDPAREVAAVLAGAPPDRPHLVASVTGTEADPQVRSRQIATLKAAGVRLAPSNARAAALAIALARG